MKKSLIAVAALAAVGAASAQSSVTLYGVADVSGGQRQVRVGDTTTKYTGSTAGNLTPSRIGVQGSEDLGNGLKAKFNYEWGMNGAHGQLATDGNKASNNWGTTDARQAWVGLAGGFGEVRLGTTNTPLDNIAAVGTADGMSSFDTTTSLYVGRASGIHYFGNFGGVAVQAFAGYNKNEYNDGNDTYKGYGLGLAYATGPLVVGGAIQQFKYSDAGKKTEGVVGGTYDFGPAKLYLNYVHATVSDDYSSNKPITSVEQAAAAYDSGSFDYGNLFKKVQEINVGVTVPFGAATLVAEYGRNQYTPNAGIGGGKVKGNDYMIGVNYAFSKRTDVYARVSETDTLKFNGSDALGDAKLSTRRYAVGLRHKF